jgi:mycothiol synthase
MNEAGVTEDARGRLDAVLDWQPAGTADLTEWASLIARTAAVEQPVWFERRDELAQILGSRKNPPATNTILGRDGEGVVRAYGRITKNADGDKAVGFGCVDPQWQRRGIGTGLLGWMETRTRQRFAADAAPDAAGAKRTPRLRLHTEEQHGHQAALFARNGYRTVRYYNEMHRPLDLGFPEVELDDELELVAFGPQLHEAVRLAHNEAFRDHWGSEPRDQEGWGLVVHDPLARPDLSAVVLERSTGRVAGY